MILRGRSRRLVAIGVAAVLALSACSGPRDPLEIGVKEVPSDIVLGGREDDLTPIETPMPPNALPVIRTPILSPVPPPPPLPERAPAPPAAVPCPEAEPFASPALLTTSEVTAPPIPAEYAYRNDGTFEVSGVNTVRGRYPDTSTRKISNVGRDGGAFTFDVAATLGDTVTTTSYRVVPMNPNGGAGIFVTRVVTKTGGDAPSTFTPSPALEFLRFPIETGGAWRAFGVDLTSRRVVTFNAIVQNKKRIDACGTLLDGITVRIDGTVVNCLPTTEDLAGTPLEEPICPDLDSGGGLDIDLLNGVRETFKGQYVWGPQYGGIVLQDIVDITTDVPGASVHRKNTATITRAPEGRG